MEPQPFVKTKYDQEIEDFLEMEIDWSDPNIIRIADVRTVAQFHLSDEQIAQLRAAKTDKEQIALLKEWGHDVYAYINR